jgi:hypothetical protein
MTSQFHAWFSEKIQDAQGPLTIGCRTLLNFAVLLLVAYLLITLVTAISTQRAANSISDIDLIATLSSGESGLDDLEEKLAVFDRRFSLLKFWIFPAQYMARVLVLVPPLDRQREAAELFQERVEIGNEAASAAVELGRSSFALRENVLSGSISLSDADELDLLSNALIDLRIDALKVLEILSKSSTVEAEFVEVNPVGLFVSLGQQLSDQEVRLGQLAKFSHLLSNVLLDDISLMEDMTGTFYELKKFANGEASAGEISVVIADLARRSAIVEAESGRMIEAVPDAVLATEYGDIVRSLRDLNVAADGLIGSLNTIVGTLAGSFSTLAVSEDSLLTSGDAMAEALQMLIDNEDEIAGAVLSIAKNTDVLLELGDTTPISLGSLGDVLEERLEPLLELSSILSGAPRIAGEVFGIDGVTRKYLVLGQTSDELRAAGGFTSSAWLLTFQSGRLIEKEYLEIATLEDLDSLDKYPAAHEALQLHMNANRMYMRDVGWDPNFPTVGLQAAELFEINRDVDVDGVISLTQWSFVELVEALGGIETESGFVGADELLSVIVAGTDDEGTVFLSSMFDSLVSSLTGEAVKAKSVRLLMTIRSLFASKDLMIYSRDSDIQLLIEETGWGGVLSNSRGDRLAIVDSNVGWNKVDRNIDRSFTYRVDLSDLDRPQAELRLGYTNGSLVDENLCDIQTHIGGFYSRLLDGCYWNYVRVYLPVGSELGAGDLLPLEAGSIASRVGLRVPGSRTVRQMDDDNGFYISGLVTVNPQSSRDVVFTYDLPKQVLRRDGDVVEYTLDVVVQAGTRGRVGTVSVVVPDGYVIIDGGNSIRVSSNFVEFTVHPERDDMIRLTLKQAS